jgi:glycosyltransferase involved in cell wall biosynthesis
MMSVQANDPAWCCVQAGHREQYGIPRALDRAGVLDRLITDLWVSPGSPLARLAVGPLGRRLRDRFHREIPAAKVTGFPLRTLAWEATASVRGRRGGSRVLARNDWWAALATGALRRQAPTAGGRVFSYCYESRALFSAARELGLVPVLGQMDPGPEEDRKVAAVVRRWPAYRTSFQPGAPAYYASWREECRLAGHIVVNSAWSRAALVEAGIEARKIVVCPLVYTPPPEAQGWVKTYPETFSPTRPLRVLFLGQCILRKGIAETIEAAQALADRPVEFTLVGNTDIADFANHFGRARIRHFPRVSRAECHAFYRDADVFLFPTHSDGFGLTQLEAQAWRLPIIASEFCAEVVVPEQDGWRLEDVSARAIVAVIDEILGEPGRAARFSRAIAPWSFDLGQLGQQLKTLGDSPL